MRFYIGQRVRFTGKGPVYPNGGYWAGKKLHVPTGALGVITTHPLVPANNYAVMFDEHPSPHIDKVWDCYSDQLEPVEGAEFKRFMDKVMQPLKVAA